MKAIEQTTPAQYARQYGLTLIEVARATTASEKEAIRAERTIRNWHKTKPGLFHAVVVGAKQIIDNEV